jgi:uncharacterized membrane protein required for colicin V production
MTKPPIYHEFREKMTSLMIGGFSFVAALAWNEAVKTLLEQFFPEDRNTIIGKFLYAILITILVVILSKYFLAEGKREEKNKKE